MMLSGAALEGMREGMEEVLAANPDDLLTHRAYADMLLRHPDPAWVARGRLIETHLRLEQPDWPESERKKLERKGRKLLKDHGPAWLGTLSPYLLDGHGLASGAYTFEMARGWLDAITAPALHVDFMRTLAHAPQARLLRRLVVEDMAPDGPAALMPLLDAPFLPRLRVFWLGPTSSKDPQGAEIVTALVARMTHVRELFTPWHLPQQEPAPTKEALAT